MALTVDPVRYRVASLREVYTIDPALGGRVATRPTQFQKDRGLNLSPAESRVSVRIELWRIQDWMKVRRQSRQIADFGSLLRAGLEDRSTECGG